MLSSAAYANMEPPNLITTDTERFVQIWMSSRLIETVWLDQPGAIVGKEMLDHTTPSPATLTDISELEEEEEEEEEEERE